MNLVQTNLRPLDNNCLVQVEKPFNEKKNPDQKIVVPDFIKDEESHSVDEGWLLKRGVNAFQDILQEYHRPKLGEKVKFVRYAGRFLKEVDENDDYVVRVVKDSDIFVGEERDTPYELYIKQQVTVKKSIFSRLLSKLFFWRSN